MDNENYIRTPEQQAKLKWITSRLTSYMEGKKLTQEELSTKLGLSRTYVNQVLNHRKPASQQLIEAVEKLTGDVFDLLTQLTFGNPITTHLKTGKSTSPRVEVNVNDIHTITLTLSIYNNKVVHVDVAND